MRRPRIQVRPNVSKLASAPRNRKLSGSVTQPAKPVENDSGCVKIEASNNVDKSCDASVSKALNTQQQVDNLQTVFLENVENLKAVVLDENIIKLEEVKECVADVEAITPDSAGDGGVIPECPTESASGTHIELQQTSDSEVKIDSDREPVGRLSRNSCEVIHSEIEVQSEKSFHNANKALSLEDYLRDTASDPDHTVIGSDNHGLSEIGSSCRNAFSETNPLSSLSEDLNVLTNDNFDDGPLSPTKSAKNRNVKGKKEVFPRRRYFKGKEPPDKSKMTMSDLIYWNPTDNPMKYAPKSNRPQAEFVTTRPESDASDAESTAPDEESAPVPKLIVGPNGEVTIDEESLYIKQSGPKMSSVVYDAPPTTYSSFREKKTTLKWNKYGYPRPLGILLNTSGLPDVLVFCNIPPEKAPDDDTILFYRALSSIGTDFTIMAGVLKKWKRYDLKQKYKHELKRNPEFVLNIVRNADCLNIQLLEKVMTEGMVNEEFEREVMENQKNSKKRGPPKKKMAVVSKCQELSSGNLENEGNAQNVDGIAPMENGNDQGELLAPVKKKRGRKPKSQSQIDSLPSTFEGIAIENPEPTKKKRGRKPKVPVEIVDLEEPYGDTVPEGPYADHQLSLSALPNAVNNEGESHTIENIEQSEKQVLSMHNETLVNGILPGGVAFAHGEQNVVCEASTMQPVKKKRGRKPKPKNENLLNCVVEGLGSQPEKKKRGRKPKPKNEEQNNGEESTTLHMKKKRGRKPKADEEEIEMEDTDMESSDDGDDGASEISKSYPKRERRLSALTAKINYNEDSDEDASIEGGESNVELNEVEVHLVNGRNTDEESESMLKSTELGKKCRGRKSKFIDAGNSLSEDLGERPVRKRGRPRKVSLDVSSNFSLESVGELIGRQNEDPNFELQDCNKSIKKEIVSGGVPVTAELMLQSEIAVTLEGNTENVVLMSETGEVIPYQVIPCEESSLATGVGDAGSKRSTDVPQCIQSVEDAECSDVSRSKLISGISYSNSNTSSVINPQISANMQVKNNSSKFGLNNPKVGLKPKADNVTKHFNARTPSTKLKIEVSSNKIPHIAMDTITGIKTYLGLENDSNVERLSMNKRKRTTKSSKNSSAVPEKRIKGVNQCDENNCNEVTTAEDLVMSEVGSYVTVETEPQCKRKRKKINDEPTSNLGKRTPKYSDFTVAESECLSSDTLENEQDSTCASPCDADVKFASFPVAGYHPKQSVANSKESIKATSISQHELSTEAATYVQPASNTSLCESRTSRNQLSSTPVTPLLEDLQKAKLHASIIHEKRLGSTPPSNCNSDAIQSSLGESQLSTILRSPTYDRNFNHNRGITCGSPLTVHAPEHCKTNLGMPSSSVKNQSIRIPVTPTFENCKKRNMSPFSIPSPSIYASGSSSELFSNSPKYSCGFRTSATPAYPLSVIPTAAIKLEKNVQSSPVMLFESTPQKSVVHIFALNSPTRNPSVFLPTAVVSQRSEIVQSGNLS